MAVAVIHFYMWEIRDMINQASLTGFKPSTKNISFRQWWLKKPWSCTACLSMWTSIVLFIIFGEPITFGVYLLAIQLDK